MVMLAPGAILYLYTALLLWASFGATENECWARVDHQSRESQPKLPQEILSDAFNSPMISSPPFASSPPPLRRLWLFVWRTGGDELRWLARGGGGQSRTAERPSLFEIFEQVVWRGEYP